MGDPGICPPPWIRDHLYVVHPLEHAGTEVRITRTGIIRMAILHTYVLLCIPPSSAIYLLVSGTITKLSFTRPTVWLLGWFQDTLVPIRTAVQQLDTKSTAGLRTAEEQKSSLACARVSIEYSYRRILANCQRKSIVSQHWQFVTSPSVSDQPESILVPASSFPFFFFTARSVRLPSPISLLLSTFSSLFLSPSCSLALLLYCSLFMLSFFLFHCNIFMI